MLLNAHILFICALKKEKKNGKRKIVCLYIFSSLLCLKEVDNLKIFHVLMWFTAFFKVLGGTFKALSTEFSQLPPISMKESLADLLLSTLNVCPLMFF